MTESYTAVDSKNVEKFAKKWAQLEGEGNKNEFRKALLMRDAREKLGPMKFKIFVTSVLNLPPVRFLTLNAMADAVEVFSHVSGWERLGWFGIRLLMRVPGNLRSGQFSRLMAFGDDLSPITRHEIRKQLEASFPNVLVKKQATKKALVPSGPISQTVAAAVRERNHLANEIKRLIATGFEFLASELDDEARRILGLKTAPKRRVAV